MAKNQTVRLRPAQNSANTAAFAALQSLGKYAPANNSYDVSMGGNFLQAMHSAKDIEAQAEAAYKSARDNATQSEWNLHNYMLGVKDQVAAQYGKDSNEFQALGMKKKSEYQKPHAKKTGK